MWLVCFFFQRVKVPCTPGLKLGSASKWQGGSGQPVHWRKPNGKGLYWRTGITGLAHSVRRIWGIFVRVSKHIIVKPNEYQKDIYVDATGIDWRKKLLPGEVSWDGLVPCDENWSEAEITNTFERKIESIMSNSAEVIVGEGATDLQYQPKGMIAAPRQRRGLPGFPTWEVNTEGLNIWCNKFCLDVQMFEFASLTEGDASPKRWKGLFGWCQMNRRIRDPYVRWCERRTGGTTIPSAVYSIMALLLIFNYFEISHNFFILNFDDIQSFVPISNIN